MTSFVPYDPSEQKQRSPTIVDPHDISRIEIFPPIGIARVGDSGTGDMSDLKPNPGAHWPPVHDIEYFYGPEVPGVIDHPFGTFRDSVGGIKRQAIRFRVYAYDRDGKPLGEINNSNGYQLSWTVHVANKKPAYYLTSGRLGPHKTDLRNPDVDPIGSPLSGDPFDHSLEVRKRLIIDPGEKTIVGKIGTPAERVPLDGKFQGSRPDASQAVTVNLGELRTDRHGRLVFIGGNGHSHTIQGTSRFQPEIISEFDSVDWIDNVCDGWVGVSVSHPDNHKIPNPQKATVISAPPKFAWGIEAPTTMYDILEDMYHKKVKYVDHDGTDFYKDIWPVLYGTYKQSWVNQKAFEGHGIGAFGDFLTREKELSSPSSEHQALRDHIFGRLREPDYRNPDQAHVILMPRLSGDAGDAHEPGRLPVPPNPIQRFSALTALQYDRFAAWKNGNFNVGDRLGTKNCIEDYDVAEQPVMLTRAMLEQTIGDPLYPGIEMFWIAKLEKTYAYPLRPQESTMRPPFRVNHDIVLPGFLSRGLSLPWQSDFDLCSTHWWPSARPDDVFVDSNLQEASARLNLKSRWRWTEGLRETTDEGGASSFFPGSTDMVRWWNALGFVAHAPSTDHPPIWVEQERSLPRQRPRSS